MKDIKFMNAYFTDQYRYVTSQPIQTIRNKIEFVINQKETIAFKYNLFGKLYEDNSFELVRRAGFLSIDFFDDEPVTIIGNFSEKSDMSTEIHIDIKPNFIFLLFTVIFGGLGIVFFMYSMFTGDKESIKGVFILFAIPFTWGLATHGKSYYKKEFENALGLEKNKSIINRKIKF